MEGLWSEHFPAGGRYEQTVICPKCNATACHRKQSNSEQNSGRYYFSCPNPKHGFIKWIDKVKPHELIQVPYCGGCGAGLCRAKRVMVGPNAGRIIFTCRVKEGQGSCGYRVWKHELERMEAPQAEEMVSLVQSGTVNCNNTDREVTIGIVMDNNQRDEGAIHALSPLIEPLDDLDCEHAAMVVEDMINSQKHLEALQEDVSSSMDRLFQIEVEVSCCEVEMRQLELQLEKVSKKKEALEGKYLIASKELEESQKLLKQKEAEHNAAKAAFDGARTLLQG